MVFHYLKVSFRNIWKNKVFSLINVLSLAVGISASIVSYFIVHYDLSFDKFHPDADRIYRIVTQFNFSHEPSYNKGVCGPLTNAVANDVTGLDASAPFLMLNLPNILVVRTTANKTPVVFRKQTNVILADERYFDLFHYHWLTGSAHTAFRAANQVVLTSQQAKIYFPGLSYDAMLGLTVSYDTIKATVTGIVAPLDGHTDLLFHDFISFKTCAVNKDLGKQVKLDDWGDTRSSLQLFVKLSQGADLKHIETQLDALLKKNKPQQHKAGAQKFHLQRLDDLHFNEFYGNFTGGRVASKTMLLASSMVALFLLLAGCINFVNLNTAQAAERGVEVGVRKVIGAQRGQLIIQFLTESLIITVAAVLTAVALTPLWLNLFSDFLPAGVNGEFILNARVIGFLAILILTITLLAGIYPAMILSRYQPMTAIRGRSESRKISLRKGLVRKILTLSQFVLAQFFMIATLVVAKQIRYVLHKSAGFDKEAVLFINTPFKDRQLSRNEAFMNKIRAIPGIDIVSLGGTPPASDNVNNSQAVYRDGSRETKLHVQEKFADGNYIRVYKIRLLAGRNLQPADTTRAILINATYARMLGFNAPDRAIGKVIDSLNGTSGKMEIAGVVNDFYEESMHEPIKPLVILFGTKKYQLGTFHIRLAKSGSGVEKWQSVIMRIRTDWAQLFPQDDFEYQFFNTSIAKFYESDLRTSALLFWATGLSVFISCLGLLSLAVFTANKRKKEIGIRKVLGATSTQVLRLLSREFFSLILLSCIIVAPLAWLVMTHWLQGFADQNGLSCWIFFLSGVVLLLVSIVASGVHTLKAAMANPIKSLKNE